MVIMQDISRTEAKTLKKGDAFLGSEVSAIHRKGALISLVTGDGSRYTIHLKQTTCRIFKKQRNPAPQKDQG
jgi:hypothetical protein